MNGGEEPNLPMRLRCPSNCPNASFFRSRKSSLISTVTSILKEAGLDPGPNRGEDSWDEFIKRHAATLWA